MSSQSSQKIQILRAFAIVAVVAIHTCAEGPAGVIIRPFLNFAVALFLGLSGYLTRSGIGWGKVRKRLLRVFIPYCIWSLIYTAARGTWARFPIHFLTGYSCGAFYFIVVYMQLTLLAPLADGMIHSRLRNLGFLITPAAIGFEYIFEFAGRELPKPYNEVFFPVWFIYYYLGMMVRADIDEERAGFLTDAGKRAVSRRWILILLPISMILQISEAFLWSAGGYGRMKYTQIKLGTLVTSCLVILLAIRWITSGMEIPFSKKFSHALTYVGDISFGIYFTHILCMDILEDIDEAFELVIEHVFPLSTILVLTVNIAAIFFARLLFPKRFCRIFGLT